MRTVSLLTTRKFQLSIIKTFGLACIFCACQATQESEQDTNETSSIVDTEVSIDSTQSNIVNQEFPAEEYSYQTVFNDSVGWGYQILQAGKVYINQPHIPAIQGTKGFKTEQDASKTAAFALFKIDNGIMPPTISKNELDSLGVLD